MQIKDIVREERNRHLAKMLIGLISVGVGSAASLVSPLITKNIIDIAIPNSNIKMIFSFALIYAVIFIVVQLSNVFQSFIFTSINNKIVFGLRSRILQYSIKNYPKTNCKVEAGDALSRLTDDLSSVSAFLTTSITDLINQIVTFAFSVSFLFILDVRLALIIVIFIPIMLITNELFLNSYKKRLTSAKVSSSALADHISEHWSSRNYLYLYNAAPYSLSKTKCLQEIHYKNNISLFKVQTMMDVLQSVITFLPPFLILFLGSFWIIQKTLSIGAIVAAMSYIGRVYSPARGIASFRTRYQNYLVSSRRLQQLLGDVIDEPRLVVVKKIEGIEQDITPRVDICSLSFSYNEEGRKVILFDNFSESLSGPGLVHITGDNGVGKSSLIALILGLLQPSNGTISINGTNIKDINTENLQKLIAYVPQNDIIYNDTLWNNYLLGRHEDRNKVEFLITKSGLHTDIATEDIQEISINSSDISSGQKKKIGITRALILNTPILILDEPIGSLDASSRVAFLEWIAEKIDEKLVIVIDHSDEFKHKFGRNKIKEIKIGRNIRYQK